MSSAAFTQDSDMAHNSFPLASNATAMILPVEMDSAKLPIYFACFFVASVTWLLLRGRQKNLPDGPRGLPFFGTMFSMGDTLLHLKLTEWSLKYGDVFSYMMGQSPVIVLNSAEAINDLFVKRGSKYSSRPKASNQADLITQNARIVAIPYGDQWRVGTECDPSEAAY